MISGAEHLAGVLALLPPARSERVPLASALGRHLVEEVVSTVELPPFDNSAMDGYAVRSADVSTAAPGAPVVLPVLGDIAAGAVPGALTVGPGSVARIMTGAPMPPGADAVVPVEATDGGVERVSIREPAPVGQHVRRRAGDVQRGRTVLAGDGRVLSPGRVALAAASGVCEVVVGARPRVAVVSTGDELVPVGQVPGEGQIVDSNSLMLALLVTAAGAEVAVRTSARDDEASVAATLAEAGDTADLVITTGGVSMGAYDTVKQVLSSSGAGRFSKVAMRPGMPQGSGRVGSRGTPVITLPGNPVSALVSFHVFVLPALAALGGASVDASRWPDPLGRGTEAVAGEEWPSAAHKVELTRVRVDERRICRSGGQGSHMLGALAEATHLAVVPAEVERVHVGDVLLCLPLLGTVP